MPRPFWLSSDDTAMFVLIFMTSTGLLQSQDSIKVCPLPSINIVFMAREVRESRNKLLHGWDAFLHLTRLLSSQILLSDLRSPPEPNICLVNLLHPSLLCDRAALVITVLLHHCLLPLLSTSYLSVCDSLHTREEAGILLISAEWSRPKVFTEKLCSGWRRNPQSDEVCAERWGPGCQS